MSAVQKQTLIESSDECLHKGRHFSASLTSLHAENVLINIWGYPLERNSIFIHYRREFLLSGGVRGSSWTWFITLIHQFLSHCVVESLLITVLHFKTHFIERYSNNFSETRELGDLFLSLNRKYLSIRSRKSVNLVMYFSR